MTTTPNTTDITTTKKQYRVQDRYHSVSSANQLSRLINDSTRYQPSTTPTTTLTLGHHGIVSGQIIVDSVRTVIVSHHGEDGIIVLDITRLSAQHQNQLIQHLDPWAQQRTTIPLQTWLITNGCTPIQHGWITIPCEGIMLWQGGEVGVDRNIKIKNKITKKKVHRKPYTCVNRGKKKTESGG